MSEQNNKTYSGKPIPKDWKPPFPSIILSDSVCSYRNADYFKPQVKEDNKIIF